MQMQVLLSLDDADAMNFKNSIQQESSIIAVAVRIDSRDPPINLTLYQATILAQIAITALSLENLSRMHWTARAFFILSLVSSIIAVYYATKQYRILGRCLHAGQVKAWIRHPKGEEDWSSSREMKFASVAAVITVSAPNMLLSFSLNCFLIGLGIYLGFTWTQSLDELAGVNGSRAVFITYVVGLCVCYGIYALSGIFAVDQTYLRNKELVRKIEALSAGAEEGPHRDETGSGTGGIPNQASANRNGDHSPEFHTPQIAPIGEPRRYTSSNDDPTRRELLEVLQEAAKLRAATAKLDERMAQILEKLGEHDMV